LWCRRVIRFLFPSPHFLDQLLIDAANGFGRERAALCQPLNFLDHLVLSLGVPYHEARLALDGTHFFDDSGPLLD
jgi:hypothetical protein